MLYPTGEKQDKIVPKYTKWYDWATVIAGDCHYIKRHMPDNLAGKVIVTNTTTPKDMQMFKRHGVTHVLTTTPVLDGPFLWHQHDGSGANNHCWQKPPPDHRWRTQRDAHSTEPETNGT